MRHLDTALDARAVMLTLAATLVAACNPDPTTTRRRGGTPGPAPATGVYATICAVCHGADGAGNRELGAPSIAGQPLWYLRAQLRKFRVGQRGTHPSDHPGQRMRAMALSLAEPQLELALQTVAALPAHPTRSVVGGDRRNGRVVYDEQCMECHRYNGAGEQVFGSGPLTGSQDWYLLRQLEAFRAGVRGHVAGDKEGNKMREVARHLSDGDARDVVAFLAELAAEHPPGARR